MVNKNNETISNKEIMYTLQMLLAKVELMEHKLSTLEESPSKEKLSKSNVDEKKSVFYSTLAKQEEAENKRKEAMKPKLEEASDWLIQLAKIQPPKRRVK